MSETAYTIGRTVVYDELLPNQPMKLGRESDYEGGAVWRTSEEAYAFLKTYEEGETYSVYELELPSSWEVDVSVSLYSAEGHNRLINSSRIIRKI